ncbi:MAG TPA: hypothetical protein VF220_09130 [Nitrososphaeraceae archaeon]
MAGIFPILLLVTISNFCNGQSVQSWLDNNARVKIVFSHEPAIPSINNFTQLNFIVKNISTGEHIKDVIGRISITNGGGLSLKISAGHLVTFPLDTSSQLMELIKY